MPGIIKLNGGIKRVAFKLRSPERRTRGRDAIRLSYAATIAKPVPRALCLALEGVTGRPRLERLYRRYCAEAPQTSFFSEAIARMGVDLRVFGQTQIPATGPLVVVANHPFGAMDGIAIGALIATVRDDVRIITHSALARVPELAPSLFPIDFSGTREAERQNVKSRTAALAHLKQGGCLVIFPAGSVMTTPKPFARQALELPWGPLCARLILRSGAAVLPIYLPGQNSRLFHVASKFSQSARYALLFHEAARMMNKHIDLHLGDLLPFEALAGCQDAVSLTDWLRSRVFSLAGNRDDLVTSKAGTGSGSGLPLGAFAA